MPVGGMGAEEHPSGSAESTAANDGSNMITQDAGYDAGVDTATLEPGGSDAGGLPDDSGTSEAPTDMPQDDPDMEAAGGATETSNEGPAEDPDLTPASDPESGRLSGITAAHNAVRENLGLPPLSWSEEIARFAQEWAENLAGNCGVLQHRDQNLYGENLATFGARPSPPATTPARVVDGWAAEEMCWDFGPFLTGDSCNSQCVANLNSNGCGHYTQVVWRDTAHVGCGVAECERDGFLFDVWVCNYDPPGNFVGREPY